MSSPWAKIEKPDPVCLHDIMSEELARDLQEKEDNKFLKNSETLHAKVGAPTASISSNILVDELQNISNEDSDAMIARMLQMQFDKDYDDELKRTEEKFNGTSKVTISFDNYRRAPLNDDFESDLEEDEVEDVIDRKHWDRFEALHRELAAMPPCGYKMKDGEMVTKHDGVMSGMKNACKLLSFPPEFRTGDGENFDLKLSNKVFNSLKMYSKRGEARRYKVHDKKEDHATAEFGMDEFTRILLYKMINNQLLERVNGVISIGKEAVILHADADPTFQFATEESPKECAIKVFKTTLSEFKQRDKYIKDDHRFKDRIGKQTARKTVHIWAEKEMANLMRLKKAGILCPQVVTLKKHVLVMSFIGEDHKPAPKLKDVNANVMKESGYITAYNQVIDAMKTMYEKANLIHADLSEYNILWYHKQCYIIDVSQSVEPSHENAFNFLFRDCTNIINFFSKKGVPDILSPNELFTTITGYDFQDKLALLDLQESFKLKPHMVDRLGLELSDNFEKAWDLSNSKVEKMVPEVDSNLVEPAKA
ncbi:unnamed protein product [Phaedon cochleariae]|uniref:Serine/threonine-protein kinase RIO3 n=1 Tax=Phaedon cochleariae TaxID=80249 RepID=A0A9N9SPC0_PHACE|nr:unnamed protein product [Phaedon cochleariae]